MKTAKQSTLTSLLCLQVIFSTFLYGCGDNTENEQPAAFRFRAVLPYEFSVIDTTQVTGTATFDNFVDPKISCSLNIGSDNFSSCELTEAISGNYSIFVAWNYNDVNAGELRLAEYTKSALISSDTYAISTMGPLGVSIL